MRKNEAEALDVCCGGRMFYYEKDNPCIIFQDIRDGKIEFSEGRSLEVSPDRVEDFTNLSWPDGRFSLIVFDPPHLQRCGDHSFLGMKYGKLKKNWKEELGEGFEECFRVLKENGVMIFKWSDIQIPCSKVMELSPYRPLLGDQRGKRRWIVFLKNKEMKR